MATKVIRMKQVKDVIPESMEGGNLWEKQTEWAKAAALYERLLKHTPQNLKIIARLMIVYRKLKDHKKEIITINKAIRIYEQQYARVKKTGDKVNLLSKKINKLLGHTDNKGKNTILSADIIRLEKRRSVIEKKYL
ncbi:MAG: hypothetical protein ABJA78_10380 [Ferruginibacter sp.]